MRNYKITFKIYIGHNLARYYSISNTVNNNILLIKFIFKLICIDTINYIN